MVSGHSAVLAHGTATCKGPNPTLKHNTGSLVVLSICAVPAGMNETQATVATLSVPGPLASKYYAMVGLAMHEALSAGGAPPPALAGAGLYNVCRQSSDQLRSGRAWETHKCWYKHTMTQPNAELQIIGSARATQMVVVVHSDSNLLES